MDATILLRAHEEERRIKELRRERTNELAALKSDLARMRADAGRAKDDARELDSLAEVVHRALKAERGRLMALHRSLNKEADGLEARCAELEEAYAELAARDDRTLEDVVGELAEKKVLEALADVQAKGD